MGKTTNQLGRASTRRLEDWCLANKRDLKTKWNKTEAAASAGVALEFPVTVGNITGALDVVGITISSATGSKAKRIPPANAAVFRLAAYVVGLAKTAGLAIPADIARMAALAPDPTLFDGGAERTVENE